MTNTELTMTDLESNEQETHPMEHTDSTFEQPRTHRISRGFATAALVAALLIAGAIVVRSLPGNDSSADATPLHLDVPSKLSEEYRAALAADDQAKASELAAIIEGQKVLQRQLESGVSPYADEDPYAGPAVTGWLWIKPNATSLSPEYDMRHQRMPVHSDSGEVIGYDYTGIGFVPLELADSPSFDEHAVRFEAYGGCDPYPADDGAEQPCDMRAWVKPHAK